jgi:hypothetical protein
MEQIFEHPTGYVPHANVIVKMNSSNISTTTIFTNDLGPCLVFLVHLSRGCEQLCFLDHYSFDEDEKSLPPGNILVMILNQINYNLKQKLRINRLDLHPEITISQVVVAGGAAQVECYELHKRSYTGKIRSFTTMFCRNTCDRITIVYLRIRIRSYWLVYGEKRSKTEIVCSLRLLRP